MERRICMQKRFLQGGKVNELCKDVAVLSESDVPAVSAIFWRRQTTEIGASLGLADDGSDITRPSDSDSGFHIYWKRDLCLGETINDIQVSMTTMYLELILAEVAILQKLQIPLSLLLISFKFSPPHNGITITANGRHNSLTHGVNSWHKVRAVFFSRC